MIGTVLRYTSIKILLSISFFFCFPNCFSKEKDTFFFDSSGLRLTAKVMIRNLNHPWSLVFLPNGNLLITEKSGKLRIANNNFVLDPVEVGGLPIINSSGQGGLFDIILHPNYPNNKWIYFSYNGSNGKSWGTELARARLKNKTLTDLQVLFKLSPKTKSKRHFGGKIIFDKNQYLFLSTGDRAQRQRAQDNSDHAGSIIRLKDNGKIPASNPFYGSNKFKNEIFTYGHRNIQGIDIHPQNGNFYALEHGPQGGDELNLIKAGANYGWPVITFGVNYGIGTKIGIGSRHKGMENPVHKWVPSIATSGMTFVTGNHFKEWENDILVGSLKAEKLIKLKVQNNLVVSETIILENLFGRIRNIKIGPDGFIYILTDERLGKLIRISKN